MNKKKIFFTEAGIVALLVTISMAFIGRFVFGDIWDAKEIILLYFLIRILYEVESIKEEKSVKK